MSIHPTGCKCTGCRIGANEQREPKTMTTAKHTPKPWTLSDGADPSIYGPDGECVVHQVCSGAIDNNDDGRTNGEFIVQACNNFKKLIEALQAAKDRIESLGEHPHKHCGCGYCQVVAALKEAGIEV